MEFNAQPGRSAILFYVRAKAGHVLDELAFVHLVAMRFRGEVSETSKLLTVIDGKTRSLIRIELQFPDWENFDGARYHCGRNLTEDGDIREDYLGALDRADPGRVMAEALRSRAGDE